jgi:hypothetical protein
MRFNNRLQKTGAVTLIPSIILFILFSSIKDTGSGEYIWIEAENADYVTAPLYIERDEDASGGKTVVCKGIHVSNSGIAGYKISVKKEGKYYFWGRCYWKDACSNQFRLQHNNTRYSLGDDPVYGKWHWVKGPVMDFGQGVNEVFLLSHDEEARMDEILLTMNPDYVPFDKLREVYFLDFEDSLVNKLQIRNSDGWRIINDSTSSVCVWVSSEENREIALLDKTDCKDDFIFQVTAKAIEPQTKLFLIIDCINEKNYRFISIDRTNVRYCRFNSGHNDLIFEKDGHFLSNEFKSIALAKTNGYLKLKIEGKTVFDSAIDIEMKGKTGIGVSEGNILLDNIAYYFPASPVQEDSFHDMVDYQFHEDRPEKAIKPFDNMKAGHNDWWSLNGKWERIREDTEDIRGVADAGNGIEKPAILILGNDFWKDYTFNAAVKVEDDSGFGICTYFQDSLNYYLFKWFHDRDGYKRQLIKIEDGNEKVLASDNEMFVTDAWYDLGVNIFRDKLTATVNDKPVLTATDHTYKEGRPGFWTNSLKNAHFDDMKISVSDSISAINHLKNYIFCTGDGGAIARSLCDWTPNSQKSLYLHNQGAQYICYVSKKVFEDVILNNINALPERFKIEVNTGRIPQDIDAVFEFTSQSKEAVAYKFIISDDDITLLKNGEVLVADTMKHDREKIGIYKRNSEWIIAFSGKKAFEYKDKTETGPWNMAVGYSGIGKGQIFLNQIIIEQSSLNK